LSYKPLIVTLLGDKIERWDHYEDFITMILRDSPLDLLLFNTAPVELTLGDVNWVLIGIRKKFAPKISSKLIWSGHVRRQAEFRGDMAEALNGDDVIRQLIRLVEPLEVDVETKAEGEERDLNVSLSLFYVPSPLNGAFVKGAVALIEQIVKVILAEEAKRESNASGSRGDDAASDQRNVKR